MLGRLIREAAYLFFLWYVVIANPDIIDLGIFSLQILKMSGHFLHI